MAMTDDEMRALKRRHSFQLLKLPGVSGVGVTHDAQGQPRLTLFLAADTPEIRAALPQAIEGQPVHIEVSGPFSKQ
jgi:hypothetical protein